MCELELPIRLTAYQRLKSRHEQNTKNMANITNWRLLEVFLRLDDVCDGVKRDKHDVVFRPIRYCQE